MADNSIIYFLWEFSSHKEYKEMIISLRRSLTLMEKEDYERISKLEADISNLTTIVMRMESKLDTWNDNYVPRREIDEMFRSRDKEIDELSQRLDRHVYDSNQESKSFKNNIPNWVGLFFGFISLLVMIYELNK